MPTSQISDYGSISDQVGIRASMKALYAARKNMFFYRIAVEEDIPKGSSTTINFRRWLDLAPAVAPIQGSVTPTGVPMEIVDIQATIRAYGRWVPIPRHINDTISDPLLKRAVDRLSYNMRLTYETVNFFTLRQGGNAFYANQKNAREDVVDVVSLSDIRNVVAELQAANVEPITELIEPVTKEGTKGIEESYFAVCHSYLVPTIRDMPGFLSVASYPDHMEALPLEIGSVENVRFIRFNIAEPWNSPTHAAAPPGIMNVGGKCSIFPILIFGREAFGISKLEGTEFNKILIHNAAVSSDDPLAQRGTAGFYGYHVCRILEENYMARLEVCAPTTR